MTPDQRKALQVKINETLKFYANEETATSSQAFDIIRWARQGYLKEDVK